MESELIDDFQDGILLNTTSYNRRIAAKAASFTINGKLYDGAVRANPTINASDDEIESIIKYWFRFSRDRDGEENPHCDCISSLFNKISFVSSLPSNTTLNLFIREHAHLKGTKYMCLEGGCGACVVAITAYDSISKKPKVFAVNSCLVPVYKCHGWSIKTVEGVGNARNGYHDIQARLASNNGTQCGYCSPGFVMNMYSLMQEKQDLTMKEIENAFGGNICRCTGYRPILETFKSFAKDAPTSLIDKCIDIEELSSICLKTDENCGANCKSSCKIPDANLEDACSVLKLNLDDGSNWYRLTSVREIFEVLNMIDDENYMLVGGNTAYGVYRPTSQVMCYIDVKGINELSFANVYGSMLVVGANLTLTTAMDYFNSISNNPNFAYAMQMAKHIDLIANIPVRNTGTIAGNLMIKHQHREFPSDIFLILETIGATITIVDSYGVENILALIEFLHTKMFKKVITRIILPARRSPSYYYKTYKVMPRAQNAHAYVNAGFLFNLNDKDNFRVLERPRIVLGGINPDFFHAVKTEDFLVGKQLLDLAVIQEALSILEKEVKPDHVLPDASAEYRKGLAVSLLYKFILSLFPDALSPKIKSGGESLERPLSTGSQDFDTDENLWPVNKPVPKLEAYIQCSGEAQYANDLLSIPGELFTAIVLAKKGPAESFTLDAKAALKIPGVYGFYSAKDIPGNNNFMSPRPAPETGFVGEEIFASKSILFNGQALGAIVADTQAIALQAAELVNVQYQGVKKPVLEMTEVVDKQITDRITQIMRIDATDKKDNVKHKISGRCVVEAQYHYTMETQTCVCVPNDEGLDVYSSTQNPTSTIWTVANALNIKEHMINVVVKRIGGGYGAKLTRSTQFAAICALSAHLSQRAVRLVLTLETNMRMVGKRCPALVDYQVDVDDDGKIQSLEAKVYEDLGALTNEFITVIGTLFHFPNAYDSSSWTLIGCIARTDKPPNTWCRGPGSTEAFAMVEHIMEHIANVTKKDPLSVRLANFTDITSPVSTIIDALKVSSNYDERVAAIEAFNDSNRWRKRGMSLVPLRYPILFYGQFHSHISIFGEDGSVVVFHGGVECGQGLNTKVAQVCAHVLDIPLHYVKMRALSNSTCPNNAGTGASIASEGVAMATKMACEEMNRRLEPIKAEMPNATWEEIVHAANLKHIDLHSSCLYKSGDIPNYDVNAACVVEIEIDVLTGDKQLIRCDILEDAGKSLNPQVDIGQIEGAYVMGLGYYLTEQLVFDPETGKLLTDRTWFYKPPGARDIPIDFRVTLLKNASNPGGVFRSKATGEPALNLSVNATFAIRRALESARKDAGLTGEWFTLKNPVTCERVWLEGSTSIKDMII